MDSLCCQSLGLAVAGVPSPVWDGAVIGALALLIFEGRRQIPGAAHVACRFAIEAPVALRGLSFARHSVPVAVLGAAPPERRETAAPATKSHTAAARAGRARLVVAAFAGMLVLGTLLLARHMTERRA